MEPAQTRSLGVRDGDICRQIDRTMPWHRRMQAPQGEPKCFPPTQPKRLTWYQATLNTPYAHTRVQEDTRGRRRIQATPLSAKSNAYTQRCDALLYGGTELKAPSTSKETKKKKRFGCAIARKKSNDIKEYPIPRKKHRLRLLMLQRNRRVHPQEKRVASDIGSEPGRRGVSHPYMQTKNTCKSACKKEKKKNTRSRMPAMHVPEKKSKKQNITKPIQRRRVFNNVQETDRHVVRSH